MRKPCLMLATGLLLSSSTAFADDPIPAGTWHCEGSICIRDGTINRKPQPFVSAQVILQDRGKNKLGVVKHNCNTGVTTTVGIEDMAEDWTIKDADLGWMCRGNLPWRK